MSDQKVQLISFTGQGTSDEMYHAARLLAFTKSTRLQMTPDGFEKFKDMPVDDLNDEMEYMSGTIASSWEFVDLIFAINNVSRAAAQQITRSRTASFAMQSQRVTDMSQVSFHIPASVHDVFREDYQKALGHSLDAYSYLVNSGLSLEDARGVLPMNSHCNLIAKYNLRSWVDLVRSRKSIRVQGEYTQVISGMEKEVLKVWPWVVTFLEPKLSKAIAIIEDIARDLPSHQMIRLAKAADLLKKEQS